MRRIPLTNAYGDKIGDVELNDATADMILAETPDLGLGFRIREEKIERFILRVDVTP